jgi:hypothetical protein
MTTPPVPTCPLHRLQQVFVADILPRVEQHGRIYFRYLCPDRKADAVQEMRALAWKWFLQLDKHGKDPACFLKAFTTFLARAVNSGRRVAGMAKAKDVLNPHAQRRHGFTVERLPTCPRASHDHLYSPVGQEIQDELEERLCDNTITPVVDQVMFRLDFIAWLKTLTPRERRIIRGMLRNDRTIDLSKRFDVSPGRISQMRREFQVSWLRFLGDKPESSQQRVGGA